MDIKNLKHAAAKEVNGDGNGMKKFKIGTYILFSLICLTVFFLLKLHVFGVLGDYLELTSKLVLGGFCGFLILAAANIVEGVIHRNAKSRSHRYNLIRLIHLLSVILVCLVIISILFVNWYTAAVSLGLLSLILGFALQTPITSFIGWINILVRAPFRVGDRIQIGDFKGDVIEINYFDTTMWEFGGTYLTNDVPSGRLIRFPNSMVLQAAVYNYSWEKFPYIWNEIPFHVAYESDLEYVSTIIRQVAKQELGIETEEKIQEFKLLVKQTPVDELNIKEYPFVTLRTNPNTWIEVIVTYLVEPKKAAATRSRLIKNIVTELMKEPAKVLFPKSNAR